MKHLEIKSSAFENKEIMPARYTCDGEDINPPLDFINVPDDAQSLVLVVEDPDSPGKTWAHWILFNIDPHTTHIAEDSVPDGAVQPVTDFGDSSYGGPCPANGTHRYIFKLYALDTTLSLSEDITLIELRDAMEGNILDQAEITALYSRE